jgi:hypothetical protein
MMLYWKCSDSFKEGLYKHFSRHIRQCTDCAATQQQHQTTTEMNIQHDITTLDESNFNHTQCIQKTRLLF